MQFHLLRNLWYAIMTAPRCQVHMGQTPWLPKRGINTWVCMRVSEWCVLWSVYHICHDHLTIGSARQTHTHAHRLARAHTYSLRANGRIRYGYMRIIQTHTLSVRVQRGSLTSYESTRCRSAASPGAAGTCWRNKNKWGIPINKHKKHREKE